MMHDARHFFAAHLEILCLHHLSQTTTTAASADSDPPRKEAAILTGEETDVRVMCPHSTLVLHVHRLDLS